MSKKISYLKLFLALSLSLVTFSSYAATSSDKILSDAYTTMNVCQQKVDAYNIQYPDYIRSSCFLRDSKYYYYICDKWTTCDTGTSSTSSSNTTATNNKVYTTQTSTAIWDLWPNPYLDQVNDISSSLVSKLDKIISVIASKKSTMSTQDYRDFLSVFDSKLDQLYDKYTNSFEIISVIKYLKHEIEVLDKSSDLDDFFCELLWDCNGSTQSGATDPGPIKITDPILKEFSDSVVIYREESSKYSTANKVQSSWTNELSVSCESWDTVIWVEAKSSLYNFWLSNWTHIWLFYPWSEMYFNVSDDFSTAYLDLVWQFWSADFYLRAVCLKVDQNLLWGSDLFNVYRKTSETLNTNSLNYNYWIIDKTVYCNEWDRIIWVEWKKGSYPYWNTNWTHVWQSQSGQSSSVTYNMNDDNGWELDLTWNFWRDSFTIRAVCVHIDDYIKDKVGFYNVDSQVYKSNNKNHTYWTASDIDVSASCDSGDIAVKSLWKWSIYPFWVSNWTHIWPWVSSSLSALTLNIDNERTAQMDLTWQFWSEDFYVRALCFSNDWSVPDDKSASPWDTTNNTIVENIPSISWWYYKNQWNSLTTWPIASCPSSMKTNPRWWTSCNSSQSCSNWTYTYICTNYNPAWTTSSSSSSTSSGWSKSIIQNTPLSSGYYYQNAGHNLTTWPIASCSSTMSNNPMWWTSCSSTSQSCSNWNYTYYCKYYSSSSSSSSSSSTSSSSSSSSSTSSGWSKTIWSTSEPSTSGWYYKNQWNNLTFWPIASCSSSMSSSPLWWLTCRSWSSCSNWSFTYLCTQFTK